MKAPPEKVRPHVAIVGAGPVGLYAAYYAGFRSLGCTILDALPFVGGQIAAFYADRTIYDVPGFTGIEGGRLVERLELQARAFGPQLKLESEVTGLSRSHAGIHLHWRPAGSQEAPQSLGCDAVLLTTGIGCFAPQPLPLPDAERWLGRGLEYRTGDASRFQGKRVLIMGGTAHAVEFSLGIAETAAEVTLVHRRDRLPISESLRHRLDASSVHFLGGWDLEALEGTERLRSATLRARGGEDSMRMETDCLVPCFGFAARRPDAQQFGVPCEKGLYPVDSTMAAGDGIWAAGDAADYPGKVRVLAADFGEACTAVNNLAATLVPGARVFPGYTSHAEDHPRTEGKTPRDP